MAWSGVSSFRRNRWSVTESWVRPFTSTITCICLHIDYDTTTQLMRHRVRWAEACKLRLPHSNSRSHSKPRIWYAEAQTSVSAAPYGFIRPKHTRVMNLKTLGLWFSATSQVGHRKRYFHQLDLIRRASMASSSLTFHIIGNILQLLLFELNMLTVIFQVAAHAPVSNISVRFLLSHHFWRLSTVLYKQLTIFKSLLVGKVAFSWAISS